MTTPLPEFYAPRQPSLVEAVATNKRVTDALLRNNPLVNAAVNSGLIRWMGNYNTTGTSDKINFLWIGEFLPLDTNLGVAQRGFSLVRDDSRGGRSAIAMFDPNPSGGGGLRQILIINSGDGNRILTESRFGGLTFPAAEVSWAPNGRDRGIWAGTNNTGTDDEIWAGRFSCLGNRLRGEFRGGTDAGTTGEVWVRVFGTPNIDSPHLVLGAASLSTFAFDIDVSSRRGERDVDVAIMGRRTGGTGFLRAAPGRIANCTLVD